MPTPVSTTRLDTPSPSLRKRLTSAYLLLIRRREVLALFDQALVSATNFLTNWLVIRNVAGDDKAAIFGVFSMAFNLMQFVRGAQEQLVSAPYTIYRHRAAVPARYAGSALVHQAVLTTLAMVFFWWLPRFLPASMDTPELRHALHYLLLASPFFFFREYARKLLFAHLKFSAAILLDTCSTLVQLSLIILMSLAGWLTIERVFMSIAAASLTSLLLWFARFRLPQSLQWPSIVSDWRGNWQFGRWALATHVIGCSCPYFMPWLIAYLSDHVTVGKFASCQTLVGLGNMLLVGVSNYLHPKSAEAYAVGGPRRLWRVLSLAAWFFLFALGSLCLLLVATGDAIPTALFGSQFSGLGPTLLCLALGLTSGALGLVAGNGIWAMDRPALNVLADVTLLGVTVATGFVWIPSELAFGAAKVVLAGALSAALVRWLIFSLLLREQAGSSHSWLPPDTNGGKS